MSTLKYYHTFLFLFVVGYVSAQNVYPNKLRESLERATNDSVRFAINDVLLGYYYESNRDSSLYFAEQNILLARKHGKKISEAIALNSKGYQLMHLGRYSESLQTLLSAFKITDDPSSDGNGWILFNDKMGYGNRDYARSATHNMFGLLMRSTQNREQEFYHFKESIRIAEKIGHGGRLITANLNLGRTYKDIDMIDSALHYTKIAVQIVHESGSKMYLSIALAILGDIYMKKADIPGALHYYHEGIASGHQESNRNGLIRNYFALTSFYISNKDRDSSVFYARKSFETLSSLGSGAGYEYNIGIALENLYLSYKLNNQRDSTFKYAGLALAAKDSISKNRIAHLSEFQNLNFSEQLRLKELIQERISYQGKLRTYALLTGLGVFLLITLVLVRNNRQKQKANKILEQTLSNLKATQTQLIQSEKMASLGELTAGIAHEIQNPLNFVNNFSEVNGELISELVEEVDKGNYEEVKVIANDIKANEQKINHHGKRADAIVKGMLQHSRSSSGKKEPTDINALADEYLRLAFHGLRAKDKSFNASMKTDFDESIGRIHVVAQDMGRVILNLITNAFYAVNEKKQVNLNGYEPMVSVSTKRVNGGIELKVQDNGNGIPQQVLDKIFQPFFTTKPTGQGTGLGLSLAYDIVKAHGGELRVETREGEGSEFTIVLS